MSSSYVLKRRRDGKFMFTLQTHYGKVLLTSHAYKDKDSALRAISVARQLAHREENYELLRTDIGLVYFVLKDARGEVIGQSRKYIDAESSRQGISLAKGKTNGARLEDLTDQKELRTKPFHPRR
jgi:uncharacterized protein YegP (UPF0339 family)